MPVLAKFAIVVAAMVCVPPIARLVRIPAMVGLMLFGVILGPRVLGFGVEHAPVADFFADLGKLLLMFSAGLEIDLALFRKTQARSFEFGVATTLSPLVLGTLCGLVFGYALIPAIVIGSLLASHTLLSLPIVVRLGVLRAEPVVVAIGATLISDTLSLIVFAICVSTFTTGFSVSGITIQIVEIIVFVPLILVGLSRAGAYILRHLRDNEEGFFVTMLGMMALAGLLADLINLPGIVGAFLAGLSVNAAVQDHPAKKQLKFFGEALFIPSFFIVTGLLIDPVAFAKTLVEQFPLVLGIILSLLVGKWIAAAASGRAFGYVRAARRTMWVLTLPQVAATLAATLVGYETRNAAGERLLDNKMFNTVLVLMLVTSILGPILTERFAPEMLKEEPPLKSAA
jgi:Kef-type K+ transport system membrane component KefB